MGVHQFSEQATASISYDSRSEMSIVTIHRHDEVSRLSIGQMVHGHDARKEEEAHIGQIIMGDNLHRSAKYCRRKKESHYLAFGKRRAIHVVRNAMTIRLSYGAIGHKLQRTGHDS